jgi:hypothetical protein
MNCQLLKAKHLKIYFTSSYFRYSVFQDTLRSLKDQGFLSSFFSFVVSYPSSANLVDIKVSVCSVFDHVVTLKWSGETVRDNCITSVARLLFLQYANCPIFLQFASCLIVFRLSRI